MNSTIASITLRGLLGRQRFLLLLPLPVLLVGLGWLADSLVDTPRAWFNGVAIVLGVAVVLPVMALIVGSGVLGSEIDDGTVVHILTKPVPRYQIVLTKLAVACAVTLLVSGVPLLIVGWLAGQGALATGMFAGAAVGALAYSALFLALSLVTRRPVLLGLAYLLIWEGILSNVLSGTRVFSVQQYVISVAAEVSGTALLDATVSTPVALVMAGVIAVGASLLAISRLSAFSVAGETS